MSAFFFELTPDRVLRAVERAGLLPTGHCSALTCLENRVYDVRLEDDAHVVAKFYRPERWSHEAILDEHRFLSDLRAAEIPVCVPRVLAGGGTLHTVEEIHYAIWPRTGGRSPDELSDGEVEILGRLLARIHNVGAAGAAPDRPLLASASYALDALAFLEADDFLPAECAGRYRGAVERICACYDAESEGVPVHRIHGDCHLGNLLRGAEGYFFLDFDDFRIGPAVQDVWMLIPGRDAEGDRQRRLLIAAYRQFRDFDERWLALVEPLRAFRFVWYAAWIARRWKDPAFPSAFPHFGTAEYWERETRDLEVLAGRLGRDGAAPGKEVQRGKSTPEPELTNKDFFWDL